MNRIESKKELILKIAVCLAMISSLVGCSGGRGSSTGGDTRAHSSAKHGAGGDIVLVFAPTANSDLAPAHTIASGSTQLGRFVCSMQVDAAGDVYFVATDGGGSNPGELKVAPSSSPNAAPLLSIASSDWTLPDPYFSLAVH
jgi:hypothetical protein